MFSSQHQLSPDQTLQWPRVPPNSCLKSTVLIQHHHSLQAMGGRGGREGGREGGGGGMKTMCNVFVRTSASVCCVERVFPVHQSHLDSKQQP